MATRLTGIIVSAIIAATLIAGWIVGAQREDNNGPVDLLILNGVVYPADGSRQFAEAIAIRGNLILRVGTNRDLKRLRRPGTMVLDAHGGAVLPGFNDAHVHFGDGSLALDEPDVRGASTVAAIQLALRDFATAHTDREWVLGKGWRASGFSAAALTRQQLDAAIPDRPAYLESEDGRTGWANSRALERAGITGRTRSPKNGTIVKDPRTGDPSGLLKGAAQDLVRAVLPTVTADERLMAARFAIVEAHRLGVTSIQTIGATPAEISVFDELQAAGDLKLRVYAALGAPAGLTDADADEFDRIRRKHEDDPLVRIRAAVADSRFPREDLTRLVTMLDKRGWQMLIDGRDARGTAAALDILETAAATNAAPPDGRRHRIEHLSAIDPGDLPRFGLLGIVRSYEPRVGMDTAQSKPSSDDPETSLQGPGRIILGSDWPMASLDPRVHIKTLAEATASAGRDAADPHVSLSAAIDAYTSAAAYASFDDQRKGTLSRGMLADIVILSADIFAAPPARLLDAVVETTIFDGKIVYTRDSKTTN